MYIIKNAIFLFCFYCSSATAQYITVDDTKTAQQLIENILVNSTCANVSGFNVKGDTFTAGQNSYGYFNSGTSNFPFTEGVIIASSTSKNAIGPYLSDKGGGNTSWLGDSDLDRTLGINSTNATVLEFDFVSLTNFISFDYIFASTEYQSYFPCEFSDGFAFLIKEKGSADSYTNIAVLPETTTPVSSKNVHPAISPVTGGLDINHPGCPAVNESYFNGFNTASSPVNYSAQTVKLKAQTDVMVGKTYHIKLVIADDKSQYYDSAVFLEAGSFSAKIDLGPDRSSATDNPICFGESVIIDTKLPENYRYKWYKDGAEIPGETKPILTIEDAGTYKVKVILSPSVCEAEDEIKIEYAPKVILSNATIIQCDNDDDGITIFDLTKVDNIIKNNNSSLSEVVYYISLANAQNDINPILNPTAFSNTTINQMIYARVTNSFGCANYAPVNLVISNNVIATQNPIISCDIDNIQDGLTLFDLNTQVTPQVVFGLPTGLTVEYYLNSTDAILQKNQLPNAFTNTTQNQQIIYARIVNGSNCFKITPETLIVNTFDPPNFQEETIFLCDGSNEDLTVEGDFSSYLWNNGNTSNTLNVTVSGNYTVTVTNPDGCQKTKTFVVKPSGIGIITNTAVTDFSGSQNSVELQYTGNGDYEFSLDGNYYQDHPLFNGVNAGIYLATIRDKNGCGISAPYTIYVLDYPRFFTPNNDGYNDYWIVKNLDQLPKSTILIFDRYGKLLKELSSDSTGWDGRYIGRELSPDDYWFTIAFIDGKIVKGHFSLKR